MQTGRRQHGFTLLAVLAALLLLALASERVLFIASQQAQREREDALLEAGAEIVRAIGSYHASSPGSVKTYPETLAELTQDERFLGLKRHLRRIPADPVQPDMPWGLVRTPDGGIRGVYSTSEARPIRETAITLDGLQLPAASRHADWKFVHAPPSVTGEAR